MKRVLGIFTATVLIGAMACGNEIKKPKNGDDSFTGDTMAGGDDDVVGHGIFEVCSPVVATDGCAEPMVCDSFTLTETTKRCYNSCEYNSAGTTIVVACPANNKCWWKIKPGTEDNPEPAVDPTTGNLLGLCLPECSTAADCASYGDTFCMVVGDGTLGCDISTGNLYTPCDAEHSCNAFDSHPDRTWWPLMCSTEENDGINNICLFDCNTDVNGITGDDICSVLGNDYYCVGGGCRYKTCTTAWADASGDCGSTNDTCEDYGAYGNFCLRGGTGVVGDQCDDVPMSFDEFWVDGSGTPIPINDPMCGKNMYCIFDFPDGTCVQRCVDDESLTCTETMPDGGTTHCASDYKDGWGLCLPDCDTSADCASYDDTFCQAMGWKGKLGCNISTGNLSAPCDMDHPCKSVDPNNNPMACGSAGLNDAINDTCQIDCATGVLGITGDAACSIYASLGHISHDLYYCIDGVCGNKSCPTAWVADATSDCGANDTCFDLGDDGKWCVRGGTGTIGDECDNVPMDASSMFIVPIDDPMCGTNMQCTFNGFDGICMQLCMSDASLTCTESLLGGTTHCVFDSTTDDVYGQLFYDPDNVAPYLGLCAVTECTGSIFYDWDNIKYVEIFTGGTASDACTDSVLTDCHIVEATDDWDADASTGAYTVTKGICGLKW